MAFSALKVWIAERLFSSDLNAEFNNVYTFGVGQGGPLSQHLDAGGFQVQNLTLHSVAGTPSPANEGRIYYQTTLDQIQVDDGTSIRQVPSIPGVLTGDLIVADDTGRWTRLAVGDPGDLLSVDGSGVPVWAPGGAVGLPTFTSYTASWDPGAIGAGATADVTVSTTGSLVTDHVLSTLDTLGGPGLFLTAVVSTSDEIVATILNETGTTATPSSGTLRVTIVRMP